MHTCRLRLFFYFLFFFFLARWVLKKKIIKEEREGGGGRDRHQDQHSKESESNPIGSEIVGDLLETRVLIRPGSPRASAYPTGLGLPLRPKIGVFFF